MLKRILAIVMVFIMAFSFSACKKDEDKAIVLPEYSEKQFEISGFWAPYEITEESFQQYKDVGFTTLAMINHSLAYDSEHQFYLGSERTAKALEICKTVGLNAILNYNDWMAERCEGEGYNGETPFSKYDLYGEYKDIITGIHICDEPYKDRHIDLYSTSVLIEDFKKVYPNADYVVNLIPLTALSSRGFASYEEMMQIYEEKFMEPFGNKAFVSVDVYPFHRGNTMDDGTLLINYQYIANSAKKYGVKPGYILQSSVGGADEGSKEFEMVLSESDLRWEVYNALAFGADSLQYYCYSLPKGIAYNYCILNEDGTPSVLYDYVKEINAEVQMFADSVLAYDWDDALVVSGTDIKSLRGSCLQYNPVDFKYKKFDNAAHYVGSQGTQDILVSHFLSEKYGEAYMFVNIAVDNGVPNNVIAEFKDCGAIAVYGGADYSGTPEIIELDENGKVSLDFEYGEGAFIIPLK